MKTKLRILYLFIILGPILGCKGSADEKERPPIVPQTPPTKVVKAKQEAIENRFSSSDFIFGSGSITKSQTVFYLIADDGNICEVYISEYAMAEIGKPFASNNWHKQNNEY